MRGLTTSICVFTCAVIIAVTALWSSLAKSNNAQHIVLAYNSSKVVLVEVCTWYFISFVRILKQKQKITPTDVSNSSTAIFESVMQFIVLLFFQTSITVLVLYFWFDFQFATK